MKKNFFTVLLVFTLVLSLSAHAFAYYTVPSDTVVYVTKTGSCYHRWGCASLKSVAASYTIATAEAYGYYGCSHCDAAFTTGVHTPIPSTSSSGFSSSSSGIDLSQYYEKAKKNDFENSANKKPSTPTEDSKLDSSDRRFFSDPIKVAAAILLGAYLLPIILGTLHSLFACSISVFRKKKPLTIENNKPNALPVSTSPARLASPLLSAPMPVPQILGQPAALYTILSPDILQSSDYSSALQSFSSWAQTCGFSVHRAFFFSDACFPDVPLKQRTEFMALLSLCKQADRPFDVLLVQHPYCLSLNPQTLEKIRRGFDDLGVKLFFRYLPPTDAVSSIF